MTKILTWCIGCIESDVGDAVVRMEGQGQGITGWHNWTWQSGTAVTKIVKGEILLKIIVD